MSGWFRQLADWDAPFLLFEMKADAVRSNALNTNYRPVLCVSS